MGAMSRDRIVVSLTAVWLTALTLLVGYLGWAYATEKRKALSFDEIDVKRINLREEDGTLRLVISNTGRFPGFIFRGNEHAHPSRRTAGMLFFNEEGTENGGLIFGGKRQDGKASGSGHLSFDQYEQDQVIQLTQDEHDGIRWAALVVSDQPDAFLRYASHGEVQRAARGC